MVVDAMEGEGDLREAIAGAATDKGLFIRELTRHRATLESIFVDLIDPSGEPRLTTEGNGAERAGVIS